VNGVRKVMEPHQQRHPNPGDKKVQSDGVTVPTAPFIKKRTPGARKAHRNSRFKSRPGWFGHLQVI